MKASLEQQIEESIAELRATRLAVDEARRLAADATVTEKSKNRMISVTVGSRGDLQALNFHGEAYRSLAPAELAKLIVDAVDRARTKCQQNAMASIQELMPGSTRGLGSASTGLNFDDMVKRFVRNAGNNLSDDQLAAFDASWTKDR
jgi:DNA-binding protein YbaB